MWFEHINVRTELKKMRFWNVKVQAENLRQMYRIKKKTKKPQKNKGERDSEKHWVIETIYDSKNIHHIFNMI